MATLTAAKKENYKRILKKEIGDMNDSEMEKIIKYLFHLAEIEMSINNSKKNNYET